ncbi:glutamine amidotransferase domain protein [Mycobacterium phage Raela]|uniref:Glutamine amidotransferase domain protein n=1 Tax=Mycobacterium phage Raela TaxID=2499054 RepID=A0A3S9U9I2_9CAUD|nr:glutamine amidotransferase domain protein [Mycobacterium phage Raela]
MCILSYIPAGIEPDSDALWNGGLSNPDGHGWAIAAHDIMLVGKSLNLNEALDTFEAARKQHMDAPALFHSRWATHGAINEANCHPFYMGGSRKTVVGHNGILPGDAHPSESDPRSDTRKFADEILSTRFRRLDRQRAFYAMTQWAGRGNKLVILTVDDRYRERAYLVNEEAGIWDTETGIWHSNTDYLGTPRWMTSGKGYSWPTTVGGARVQLEADDPKCLICNWGYINTVGFCDSCGTCQDCFEWRDDCQCYVKQSDMDNAGQWWSDDDEYAPEKLSDTIDLRALMARIQAEEKGEYL